MGRKKEVFLEEEKKANISCHNVAFKQSNFNTTYPLAILIFQESFTSVNG